MPATDSQDPHRLVPRSLRWYASVRNLGSRDQQLDFCNKYRYDGAISDALRDLGKSDSRRLYRYMGCHGAHSSSAASEGSSPRQYCRPSWEENVEAGMPNFVHRNLIFQQASRLLERRVSRKEGGVQARIVSGGNLKGRPMAMRTLI